MTLTFKEKRILGVLAKHPAAWKNVARQFSMGEADFKVAATKAMTKSYRIGKEQTKLANKTGRSQSLKIRKEGICTEISPAIRRCSK